VYKVHKKKDNSAYSKTKLYGKSLTYYFLIRLLETCNTYSYMSFLCVFWYSCIEFLLCKSFYYKIRI